MQQHYTATEQMVVCGARLIKNGDVCYVGIGMPMLATWTAKFTHAPALTAVYEVGIIRTSPCPLGYALDSLPVQTRSDMLSNFFDVNAMAANDCFHAGFIGAGQIDRFGNVNSTVAGSMEQPRHRWPGSGGANDITSLCRNVIVILKQNRRRFPERVDFITSPGYLDGTAGAREACGLPAYAGPSKVITDLGIYGFEGGEMVLESVHTHMGVTVDQIRQEVGWNLRVSPQLAETKPPEREYLHVLREEVDPFGVYQDGKPIVR